MVAVELDRRHHRQGSPEPLVVLKRDHHTAHGLLGFGEPNNGKELIGGSIAGGASNEVVVRS